MQHNVYLDEKCNLHLYVWRAFRFSVIIFTAVQSSVVAGSLLPREFAPVRHFSRSGYIFVKHFCSLQDIVWKFP